MFTTSSYNPLVHSQTVSPCGHSVSGPCVQELGRSGAAQKCPVCNTTGAQFFPNVVVRNLVGTNAFKCNHCDTSGLLGDVKSHLDNCQRFPIECGNCGVRGTRAEILNEHVCPEELVECECQQKVARKDLTAHENNLCARKEVMCPLKCDGQVPRSVKVLQNGAFLCFM